MAVTTHERNMMVAMSAPTAVDLFAGAGGTTQGLRDAGYTILAAIENDRSSADSFVRNHPETHVVERDIQRVNAPAFARTLGVNEYRRLDLLTACPPVPTILDVGER